MAEFPQGEQSGTGEADDFPGAIGSTPTKVTAESLEDPFDILSTAQGQSGGEVGHPAPEEFRCRNGSLMADHVQDDLPLESLAPGPPRVIGSFALLPPEIQ